MVHAGTADDTVDNEIRLYRNDTVFERLAEAGHSWRVYRHPEGLAQVMAFDRLWATDEALANWHPMADFAAHVAADALATYSFIEPCHDGPHANSQHPGNNTGGRPGSDFRRGEQLIASVYEALRAHPSVFAKTTLIITYDEHGGFYDHVPPPRDFPAPQPLGAPPPRQLMRRFIGWFVEQPTSRFAFRLLGPRVPAVVVSPLVAPAVDPTLYDHTAVPATLRALFAPGSAPLSAREERSATLEHLWSLPTPRTDLPDLSDLVGAPEPEPLAEEPRVERDDEFARQLRRLGELVRDELRPRPGILPEDPATLFTARAAEARRPR
jgi:phospholipase C